MKHTNRMFVSKFSGQTRKHSITTYDYSNGKFSTSCLEFQKPDSIQDSNNTAAPSGLRNCPHAFFSGWWTWQLEWHPFQNHTPIISPKTWQSWIFCFCTFVEFWGRKIDTFFREDFVYFGEDPLAKRRFGRCKIAQILDPMRQKSDPTIWSSKWRMAWGFQVSSYFFRKQKGKLNFLQEFQVPKMPYKAILGMGFPLHKP